MSYSLSISLPRYYLPKETAGTFLLFLSTTSYELGPGRDYSSMNFSFKFLLRVWWWGTIFGPLMFLSTAVKVVTFFAETTLSDTKWAIYLNFTLKRRSSCSSDKAETLNANDYFGTAGTISVFHLGAELAIVEAISMGCSEVVISLWYFLLSSSRCFLWACSRISFSDCLLH